MSSALHFLLKNYKGSFPVGVANEGFLQDLIFFSRFSFQVISGHGQDEVLQKSGQKLFILLNNVN